MPCKAPIRPRLTDLVRIFEPLTKEDANDAAAWFNLGLARAWLGDNPAALEALRRYVELEADENAAGEAATLMEVLRCGQGQEDDCDYQEHVFGYQFRDPQPVVNLLQEWERGGPARRPAHSARRHVHGAGAGAEHGRAHHRRRAAVRRRPTGRLCRHRRQSFSVHQPLEGAVRSAAR